MVAFALHVFPNLRSGSILTRPGPLLASSDQFTITVHGRGGHASTCHSNHMRIDEDAMAVGIAAHAAVALSYLA